MQFIPRFLRLLVPRSTEKPIGCISFPKSGRTWLRVMLDELGISLLYTHAGAEHGRPCLPEELNLREAKDFCKIVFLHRDPRDTAVSGFYQKAKRRDGYDGSISDFIRDSRHGIEKIIRFNLLWLDFSQRASSVFVVSYEELHGDTASTLAAILEFLETSKEADAIVRVVRNNSFEKMQAKERAGAFGDQYMKAMKPKDVNDPSTFKVCRGVVGGYSDRAYRQ